MTVRLSYTLNNSNSFNKFTPTWTTQIMYCRRVWVKLGRPQKQRANAVWVKLGRPQKQRANTVSVTIDPSIWSTDSEGFEGLNRSV